MHFTVDFTLPEDYTGDLEYLFFGDDDMWVFLDGTLVVDIGGIHLPVGEYADLWDYIPKGNTTPHRLDVFFIERGASGSTCWMQFTIPDAAFTPAVPAPAPGGLELPKAGGPGTAGFHIAGGMAVASCACLAVGKRRRWYW